MTTETTNTRVSTELLAAMEEAGRIALSNVRDAEVMRQAAERMDRRREQLRQEQGEMNIAVELVRAVRDEA